MKKLCIFLVLLLLAGCGQETVSTEPTRFTAAQAENTESGLVTLDIYAINDLHGRFLDSDQQPGVDELSAYLKQAQQTGNTILLSTGDMWQGTAESGLTGGFLITEWMNAMGFAAMTLGGHEYDWGEAQIRANKELAQFPFLGINIYSRQTDTQADYCQSSTMVELDGAQIGIIGAIGNCNSSIDAGLLRDVYFKTGEELTELVKAEAQKLRSQGADFIIYTLHDGYDGSADTGSIPDGELAGYYDAVLSEGFVDLVLEADTHYSYVLTDSRGVYHLQAGGNNKALSHVGVLIDLEKDNSLVYTAELLEAGVYSQGEDDPVAAALLEKYAHRIDKAEEVLCDYSRYRSGAEICQLVADLYCVKGTEKWGKEYDIVLGGGYIACRAPGYLPAGDVTYSKLYSLLPFNNTIMLCSIRGRDLQSKFLETENAAYYIKTTQYGESIRGNIDPDATYYVVTDSYCANYAPNNLTILDVYDENVFARDLAAEYFADIN